MVSTFGTALLLMTAFCSLKVGVSAYPRHAESAVDPSLALGLDEENVTLVVLRLLKYWYLFQDHLSYHTPPR